MTYGEVTIEAQNKNMAEILAEKLYEKEEGKINWFESELTDITVEAAY